MAHDVFISFSTEDKAIADAACAILEAQRIRCWIAPRDVQPGIPYPQSIMEGIRGSRVLVLILSAKSNTSKHVMREVERAVNCEIAVIPFRIEDVSLSGSMEYLVGSLHWLDALTPPLERHLETLARRILALLAEFPGGEASASPPRGKDVSTKGHVDRAPAAPRADSPPSTADAGQQPKGQPQGVDGWKPKARAMPTEVIESEPVPIQTPAAASRQGSSISSQLGGAPPKRRNIPWPWFFVAALPLLAFLGVIIHNAASPSSSTADGSKPASPTTHVESPKPAPASQKPQPPPPQPERERTNSIGIKLVRIEAGEFLMGMTKDQVDELMRLFPDSTRERSDDEQPQHPVRITRPFFLGIHEVTVGQFRRFMETSGYQTQAEKDGKGSDVWDETKKAWELDPSKNWRNPGFPQTDDHPVVCVSHNDAMAFCQWLSQKEGRMYRLPTEAEWEFACRANSTTLYPFGDDADKLREYAWFAGNSEQKTHPVGQKLPNSWGLHDMLGNVWEWCADWYDWKYYASSQPADPPGANRASLRVFRGGCWIIYRGDCRPASRDGSMPESRSSYLGFRVAAVQE